jgi:hypothetical protein
VGEIVVTSVAEALMSSKHNRGRVRKARLAAEHVALAGKSPSDMHHAISTTLESTDDWRRHRRWSPCPFSTQCHGA